jgi:hypothetical protein
MAPDGGAGCQDAADFGFDDVPDRKSCGEGGCHALLDELLDVNAEQRILTLTSERWKP